MRSTGLDRVRKVATAGVVVVLLCALSYGISTVLVGHASPRFALTATAGRGFTVTSKVYAADCTTTLTALLYPGLARCLVVSVEDPFGVALSGSLTMTVESFAATPTAAGPNACTVTTATPTSFTHAFSAAPGTHVAIREPFRIKTSGATQDACENGTFHFAFTGTAHLAYAASCETASLTPGTVTTDNGARGGFTVSGGTVLLSQTAVVSGNVTVASSGTLVSTGATITGTVTSAGGAVALESGTKVGKNVTANGGRLAIGTTSTVSGTVTAVGTSALCIDGSGPSTGTMVHIGGSVTVSGMPSGSTPTLCAARFGKNLTYKTNAGTARIGSVSPTTAATGSVCEGGDSVVGTLVVTANTGKVTVSGDTGTGNLAAGDNSAPLVIRTNVVEGSTTPHTGNLTVTSNAGGVSVDANTVARNVTVSANGGGTLLANTVAGNCVSKDNSPQVHGAGNTVTGSVNTCNGTH